MDQLVPMATAVALLAILVAFRNIRQLRGELRELAGTVRATGGLARDAAAQTTSMAIQVTDLLTKSEDVAPKPAPPPVRLADWEEQTMGAVLALKDKDTRERKAYHEQIRLAAIIAKLDRFVKVPFGELNDASKAAIARLPTVEELELAARANR